MSWEPRDTYVAACGEAFPKDFDGKLHEQFCPACRAERGDLVAHLGLEDEMDSFLAVIQQRYPGREFVVVNGDQVYLLDGDKTDAKSVWEFSLGWRAALAFAEERYGSELPESKSIHPATAS